MSSVLVPGSAEVTYFGAAAVDEYSSWLTLDTLVIGVELDTADYLCRWCYYTGTIFKIVSRVALGALGCLVIPALA